MKRLLSIFLLFLLILLTVSCDNKDNIQTDDSTEAKESFEEVITTEPVSFNTYDLSQFSIIFNINLKSNSAAAAGSDLASNLKKRIVDKSAIDIPMKKHTVTESLYEIMFIDADRPLAKEYCNRGFSEIDSKYGVIIDGTKILILGVDVITIDKSMNYFLDTYINRSGEIVLENKAEKIFEIDFSEEKLPDPASKNEYRLVSHNIVMMRNGYGQKPERLNMLRTTYSLLEADILALQECDRYWRNQWGIVDGLESIGYSLAPITNEYPNPIFYKTSKFKCLNSGNEEYTDTAEKHPDRYDFYWSYTWALLEDIQTKKQCIILSTHLVSYSLEERNLSVKQLIAKIKSLESEYGVPVIACGDFNSSTSTNVYGQMKLNMFSARDKVSAENKKNMHISTGLSGLGTEPNNGAAIDHVFYSKAGVSGQHFETLISQYGYKLSDHNLIFFDFTLD